MVRAGKRATLALASCCLAVGLGLTPGAEADSSPLSTPGTGAWTENGVPVCIAPGEQTAVEIVSDGAGGACLAWLDSRSGTGVDIYATRIDSQGHIVAGWVPDGSPVCTDASNQSALELISDGAGGIIVAWIDSRDGNPGIYAQHILGDGTNAPSWPADGMRVAPLSSRTIIEADLEFEMELDGAGGAMFVWTDVQSGVFQVYCQRLTGAGSVSAGWPAGGLAMAGGGGTSISGLAIAAGLTGGAFLAWIRYVECSGHGCPTESKYSEVAHASAGIRDWGLTRPTHPPTKWARLVSDGVGGVIHTDARNGYSRIDVAGNRTWTVIPDTNPCSQLVFLLSDGVGGCYAVWNCYEQLAGVDAFATRLTGAGNVAPGWTLDGTTIDAGPGNQFVIGGVTDGLGGEFLAAIDERSGEPNVYALHVDEDGAPSWPPNGRIVCNQPVGPSAGIATSDPRSAILGLADLRSGPADIYAQKISLDDPVTVTVSLVAASAEPSAAHLVWQILQDSPSPGSVERRTDGTEWSEVGQCLADGVGRMRFEDRDIVPGQRYGYRLQVRDGETRVTSDETWLTIPAEYTLALERMQGNPVMGNVDVAFVLPSGEAAAIELVDLAGRRIVARSVGEFGAGRHTVSLASRGVLPPGIYFLRLFQGERSVMSRICILQ